MKCRFCGTELKNIFVSLGSSPLANSYLTKAQLNRAEAFFPLEAYVCGNCFLVQLDEFESAENIFNDQYAYFSSYSTSLLKHSKDYCEKMIPLLGLGKSSQVIEVASNDGYLLQYFKEKKIPVLGIEPADNAARVAREKGIPTESVYLTQKEAGRFVNEKKQADLVLGNNVLAHVPRLNDFVRALKMLMKPQGVLTMEFPHLVRLMERLQFDTIYHEHFSYFSFSTVRRIFEEHGVTLFDVEEISTHGGSLRIFGRHAEDQTRPVSANVQRLLDMEKDRGMTDLKTYAQFQEQVKSAKRGILEFLIDLKKQNKTIVGYGAPAKGNTLLNYCGIRNDFIDYTCDVSPHKQGHFLPGSRIPIEAPQKIKETRPDYIFILAWNLKEEIMEQLSFVKEWKAKFFVAIPELKVF